MNDPYWSCNISDCVYSILQIQAINCKFIDRYLYASHTCVIWNTYLVITQFHHVKPMLATLHFLLNKYF